MQDVSVRVGGLTQSGFGPYAQNFNVDGDIDTAGARIVLVENYSPWTFQISGYTVPAMQRRTFTVDNYPTLHWTITNGAQLVPGAYLIGGGIGELRTVKIILDPPLITTDGPVYPSPQVYSGYIDSTVVPDNNPTTVGTYIIDARDLLDSAQNAKWVSGGLQWGQAVRDPAIVGFQAMITRDLAPSGVSAAYDNVPRAAAVLAGSLPMPQIFMRTGPFAAGYLAGRDYTQYWDLPGPSIVRFSTGQRITAGAVMWTAWVGYHL